MQLYHFQSSYPSWKKNGTEVTLKKKVKVFDPGKHHPNHSCTYSKAEVNVNTIVLHFPCQQSWKKNINRNIKYWSHHFFHLLTYSFLLQSVMVFSLKHITCDCASAVPWLLPKLHLISAAGLSVWGIHDQTCSVTHNKLQIIKELSWCRQSGSVCSIYHFLLL